MSAKKAFVFGILFDCLAIFCFCRSFVSMGQGEREFGQVRAELQRATERERELEAELELVNKQLDASIETIRDSQRCAAEIRASTERSEERFRYGFEELGNLRRAIAEAEGAYKDMENQLSVLERMLSYDDSNLEIE